jgi:hypothetical protein
MRSAGELLVNRLQRRGVNMYNHFAVFVTNDRLWEFFISRHGSNRVQDGCMHVSSPFDVFHPTILLADMPPIT